MWIFDKLFNRKIEGESSADSLLEHVVQDGNKTEVGGDLYVDGDTEVNDLDVLGNLSAGGKPVITEPNLTDIEEVKVNLSELTENVYVNIEDLMNGKDAIFFNPSGSGNDVYYTIIFPVNSTLVGNFNHSGNISYCLNGAAIPNDENYDYISVQDKDDLHGGLYIVKIGSCYFMSTILYT